MIEPPAESTSPAISTSGRLCEGGSVRLAWPELAEIQSIAALVATPEVRRWSLDPPLDAATIWAGNRFLAPYRAILAVRSKTDDSFLGTFGWSDFDPEKRTVWFGLLAIDRSALGPGAPRSPGVDAALALRDWLFVRLGVDEVHTYYLAGNERSRRAHEVVGQLERAREIRRLSSGDDVEVVFTHQIRARWAESPRHATWMEGNP